MIEMKTGFRHDFRLVNILLETINAMNKMVIDTYNENSRNTTQVLNLYVTNAQKCS